MHIQRQRTGRALALVSTMLSGVTGCGPRWPEPGTPAAAKMWPTPLVGSWTVTGRTARGSSAPDTSVWVLERCGRLTHREVRVRTRAGRPTTRDQLVTNAMWWTESRRGARAGVRPASTPLGEATAWTLCTKGRPGRHWQCGHVVLDTVLDRAGHVRRRLAWTGATFRRQHWVFLGPTALH